ncbi:hypothetical protein MMC16_004057 [Acarospora aff. strigata]|nr:hypothetical protein [Acarospora aff. strigata]
MADAVASMAVGSQTIKTENTKPFVEQIYDQLAGLFGLGRQELFQMEMPARLLEKGNYDYLGSDTINTQQIKPQTVVDAEFRLTDDMYSIPKMVAGPKGAKVSNSYANVINQLVPSSTADSGMAKVLVPDQERICDWLNDEVADWNPPKKDLLEDIPEQYDEAKPKPIPQTGIDDNVAVLQPIQSLVLRSAGGQHNKPEPGVTVVKKVARIDLYQKLLNAYESERFRWAEFNRKSRPGEKASAETVDNYNRMLAFDAPIVDAKLEGMWTMLLVRGQYHRVRRYIGFVDIESASEMVQKAKENLRASMMRSIDETQNVYPIYLQPSNWAKHLSTNFKPQDLLSSESVSNAQNILALEKAELEARNAFVSAQKTMTQGYSDAAIQIIEIYFDTATRFATNKIEALKKLTTEQDLVGALEKVALPPVTKAQFEELKKGQTNCLNLQVDLQNKSEALSRASLGAASARGNDTSALLAEIHM